MVFPFTLGIGGTPPGGDLPYYLRYLTLVLHLTFLAPRLEESSLPLSPRGSWDTYHYTNFGSGFRFPFPAELLATLVITVFQVSLF